MVAHLRDLLLPARGADAQAAEGAAADGRGAQEGRPGGHHRRHLRRGRRRSRATVDPAQDRRQRPVQGRQVGDRRPRGQRERRRSTHEPQSALARASDPGGRRARRICSPIRRRRRSTSASTCGAACTWCSGPHRGRPARRDRRDMERLVQQAGEEGVTGVAAPPHRRHRLRDRPACRRAPRRRSPSVADDYLPGWSWQRARRPALVFTMTAENHADDPRAGGHPGDADHRQPHRRVRRRRAGDPAPGLGNDRILVQLPGVDDPERVRG